MDLKRVTRGFELATPEFEIVTHGFVLVTRGFELVTRVLLSHILCLKLLTCLIVQRSFGNYRTYLKLPKIKEDDDNNNDNNNNIITNLQVLLRITGSSKQIMSFNTEDLT